MKRALILVALAACAPAKDPPAPQETLHQRNDRLAAEQREAHHQRVEAQMDQRKAVIAQRDAEEAQKRAAAQRDSDAKEAAQKERAAAELEADCASDRDQRAARRIALAAEDANNRRRREAAEDWVQKRCKRVTVNDSRRVVCDDGSGVAKICDQVTGAHEEFRCPPGAPKGVTATGITTGETAEEQPLRLGNGTAVARDARCAPADRAAAGSSQTP